MNPDHDLEQRLRAYAARLDAAAPDAGPVVAATGRVTSDRRRRTWLAGTAVAASLAAIAAVAYLAGTGDDGRRVTGGVIAGSPASTAADVAPSETTVPVPTTTTAPPVPDVVLPSLLGLESTRAGQLLHQFGLTNVSYTAEPSDTAAPGRVVRTVPEPTTRVTWSEDIVLVVSTGPADSGLTLDSVGRVVRDLLATDAVPTLPPPDAIAGGTVEDDGYLGRLAGTDLLVRRFVVVGAPGGPSPATCIYLESAAALGDFRSGSCWPTDQPPAYLSVGTEGGATVAFVAAEAGDAVVALENGERMELAHPVDGMAIFLASAFSDADGPLGACWFDDAGRVNRTESPIGS